MTTPAMRTVLELPLRPIVGTRFQPTGFPDLGAATFERSNEPGQQLLVESVQSMGNHLEGATWDTAAQAPPDVIGRLPYVRVVGTDGEFLTCSRLEAHRLASAWVLDSTIDGTEVRVWLAERFGLRKGSPLDNRAIARAVFALDPVSLLHGVFFAQQSWPWQPKIARAVTSFIEASDVAPAISGGVKRDSVVNAADKELGLTSDQGYGMVPHHRTEYTAAAITLFYVCDEQQLRSYGLTDAATELLSALAAWEIATVLHGGLRLRTACDLIVDGPSVPDLDAATSRLIAAVSAADAAGELADPITTVFTPGRTKAAKATARS